MFISFRKKRKSFEEFVELKEKAICLVQRMERFQMEIYSYHDLQQPLFPDETLLAAKKEDIVKLKALILQSLDEIPFLESVKDSFLTAPVYTIGTCQTPFIVSMVIVMYLELLNEMIQYIVAIVHRMERNYTIMQIANFHLEKEKEANSTSSSLASLNPANLSHSSLSISTHSQPGDERIESGPGISMDVVSTPVQKRVRFSSEDSVSCYLSEGEFNEGQEPEEHDQRRPEPDF